MKKIFTLLTLSILAIIGISQSSFAYNSVALGSNYTVLHTLDIMGGDVLTNAEGQALETAFDTKTENQTYAINVTSFIDTTAAHSLAVGTYELYDITWFDNGASADYTIFDLTLDGTDNVKLSSTSQAGGGVMTYTESNVNGTMSAGVVEIVLIEPIEYDLQLTNLHNGDTLTQDQIDFLSYAADPQNDVYLEINGSTYHLPARDTDVISETASTDGYLLDYNGGTLSLGLNGGAVDVGTPYTLKLKISENNFKLENLNDGWTLDYVQDYIMTEMLAGTNPVYLQIEGSEIALAFRDTNVISETASTDGYLIEYIGGDISIDSYGSPVGFGTEFAILNSLPPTISGSGVYLSDYDSPSTVADVQATLTATDDPDGDLTSSITVYEDNYTGNETVLGNYPIIFRVEDAAGNISEFTVTVQVVDITAPVMTLDGAASITLGIDDTFTDPGVTVTDNVDSSPTWSYDGGAHGVDTSTPGTYTVTYNSTDTSGNAATPITRTVIVEDTESPYVQGGVSTITTFNSQNLTIDSVLSGITIVDDHDLTFDGSYTVTVDNYSGNESVEGSYDVTITATDAAGNVMTHVITIVVIDDLPPVISASEYLLTPEEVSAMSQAEIKAHIESRTP